MVMAMTSMEVPMQSDHATIRVPMLIDGEWIFAGREYDVFDPFRGSLVATAPRSDAEDLDRALSAAVAAREKAAGLPATERARILRRVSALLVERKADIAEAVSRETGKAIKDSRSELARSIDTITLSAEEAVRIEGEHVPLDASPMGFGKIAMLLRFPVGVVAAITPFNAPVNLACHKIGPAIAAGNVVVLKAPPQCPGVIHKLVQCFVDAELPAGFLNVLYGADIGPPLVRDERVEFITFTGSTRAGAHIRANAGLRRVALELGGIGPTIVHEDANLGGAAPLCARNAMCLAGQSCISVQPYEDIEPVIREISERRLGLQGGIFTRSLDLAIKAARTMRVGGVIINGTSTFRTDQLAYGGVKDSGIGREGPKFAIREMTEQRLIVFNL
jgi:acyl-CoA reductase-like NAD-dependent aldehyde dehydrogenase